MNIKWQWKELRNGISSKHLNSYRYKLLSMQIMLSSIIFLPLLPYSLRRKAKCSGYKSNSMNQKVRTGGNYETPLVRSFSFRKMRLASGTARKHNSGKALTKHSPVTLLLPSRAYHALWINTGFPVLHLRKLLFETAELR